MSELDRLYVPSYNIYNPEYDFLFKIILVGDTKVGKSALMIRYVDETFTESMLSTIGVDFKMKSFTRNNKNIKIQLWDTAGQERFRSIISSFYRGAHAVIVCFDLTNRESFEHIVQWLNEIMKYGSTNVLVILVGNKSDLKNKIIIDSDEIEKFVKDKNLKYFITSSKTGDNIDSLFDFICDELIKRQNEIIKYNQPVIIPVFTGKKKKYECCKF